MSNTPIPLPNIADAKTAIEDLTSAIKGLQGALGSLGGSAGQTAQQTGNIFKNLTGGAQGATGAIKTLFSQMTGTRPAGVSAGSLLDYGVQGDWAHDISMFPLRFMQSTVSANRQLNYNASSTLSGMQYAQGRNMGDMLGMVAGQMGSGRGRYGLRGTADEVTNAFATARQYGAMYDFSTPIGGTQGNPRTEGFFKGTAELANMYPGASLPGLASTLGSFSANTAAQQRSLFMSGGAFGMIGQGGTQKTVSQWAESILNYMEDQRFGAKRGTPFTYPELLSQNFPGSNMDAWLDINGVPPDMKEAWWNYVMAKAKSKGSTGGAAMAIEAPTSNVAFQRSRAVSASAQPAIQLAGRMNPAYVAREGVNTSFNRTMGSLINSLVSGPVAQGFAHMPDTVEEFIMQLLENSGSAGAAAGGFLGYGTMGVNLISNLFDPIAGLIGNMGGKAGNLFSDLTDAIQDMLHGDVGDIGDVGWGDAGGRGTGALHPDVNKKVSAMMRANPRVRVNSGRRDEVTQRSLRGKGHSRVSGKSSAHTRGLAADLGPASEYGWIMANASKFGLQSGANHGEPWHVGIGGIGDTPATGNIPLSSIFSKLYTGELNFEDVGSIFPAFFTLLSGKLGGGGEKETNADIEKRFAGVDYEKSLTAAGNYNVGGKWGGTAFADYFKSVLKTVAGQQTHDSEADPNAATLEQALQALGLSSTGLSSGAMVALLANKVGFTGDDLITAVAIAGRESKYNPKAFADDDDDLSYGLFQINMLGNLGPSRRAAYNLANNEELFNPITNLRVAYKMAHENSTPFYAWGPYRGDSPRDGTDVNAATGYVREAGLLIGDVDGWSNGGGGGNVRIGPRMSFNNTFVISGGGGGGGIDVRRTASQIADQLERQMQSRLEAVN